MVEFRELDFSGGGKRKIISYWTLTKIYVKTWSFTCTPKGVLGEVMAYGTI